METRDEIPFWYAIVGNNGSGVGMLRFFGALALVLVPAHFALRLLFGQ
ncbi:hypothetical protein [Neoaquamicrobium microcysteis]|nr:hypothetical protein [Mesorhizobium microcysteis]